MKNYLSMLKFIKGHEKLFIIAVIVMFFSSFFEIFQISLFAPLVDIIFNKKQMIAPNPHLPQFVLDGIAYMNAIDPAVAFKYAPVVLVVMIVIKVTLVFAYSYLMSDISQRIIRDIRYVLYDKIQNLSLEYFSEKRTGELVSRITYDTNIVENAVSYGLIDLVKQTFVIIICIITAFSIDPISAVIIFLVFPPLVYPLSRIGKILKKISGGIQEKMADINSLLLETISGIKLVKACGTEDYESKRFHEQNHVFYKLKMKSVRRLILISPLTEVFGAVCLVLILVLLGKKVFDGEMSFGIFALFIGAIMSIISPIKKLGNVNALIQQALAANKRIYDVLGAEIVVKEKEDAIEISEMKDSIKLENASFHYYEESGLVLKNIDLEVKKGELVAIVGPTGTGKTTLVNLIPRFYDPTEGRVTIDGVDLKDVSFKSLRDRIGIVTQETILFNDTVSANIAYGNMNASQEQIEEAAKKAFAHQFIKDMPDGYGTVIGDRGFRLSGGEKQRITIARAILRNAPMLILDEATSALDSESEKFVQDALDKLMQGRTVIAIAHRLSTIKKADKIVVLDEGRIVGVGKHEDLLEECPLYNKLHTMQFQL